MTNRSTLYLAVGLLTTAVLAAGLAAWLQGIHGDIGVYELFPLLGSMAWLLMWTHYVSGSIKRYLHLAQDKTILKNYFSITGVVVLALILLHPGLLYIGLFNDGLGLPPYSAFAVYQTASMRIALVLGSIALTAFLLFELGRWFRHKGWWRYIEGANIAAMGLIFVHGLLIGGGLSGWFRVVWILLGVLLALSIVYNWRYDKQQANKEENGHGRKQQANE